MLRWFALISWTVCSLTLLHGLESRRRPDVTRARVVHRVERRIKLLGVEWTTDTRDSPAPVSCGVLVDSTSARLPVSEVRR